ncbi:MAG TPA: amino acid permease [Gemmatimonas aurantiaca]|uniref:Amino acid permease n=2 Tax=Gemmatimonas aurantiaca TaxID=173480 RepID=C1A996_GEMAT|nr:amino acid permease [Gemmatimonas aurantiaca]BAH39073.1 amino acid permease [Gemmatimonas aurantiaca T-27]HCT57371.1 amino acid permease [Gemmatimonas aurantiaca]
MNEPRSLRRTLGFTDLLLLGIGTVIGSGIYLVPSVVLRETGMRPGVALAVWTVGGVLSLLGALTYAELGAAKPDAGGLYSYLRDAFGPLPAFLYGWTMFFIIASGSIATLAVAFSSYLGQLVTLSPLGARVTSVVLILLLAAINVRGTRNSANLQNFTTVAKVVGLLALAGVLITLGKASSTERIDIASPELTMTGIGGAMIAVLWAYEGWQYVTFSAGEARDPQREFPRAISMATAALVAIYLVANIGYVAALGPEGVAGSERVAAQSVAWVLGTAAGNAVGALILISILSAANGLFLTTPRMFFAMARDGVFFRRLADVHPRFETPAFAIGAIAVWSIVLALTGTFQQLLTYVVFTGWGFYALGGVAVFALRRRAPNMPRPFRVPGYPVTPILFVLAAVALVLNTMITQPSRAAVGLGAVLLGAPVYYLWRRRSGYS